MTQMQTLLSSDSSGSWLDSIFRFCLKNKLVVFLLLVLLVGWGIAVVPFSWNLGDWPRDPVPVDTIPDLGENQQIVFTSWPGRSPNDVEDQITCPLTTAFMGISGIKTVRSYSHLGHSTIHLLFRESVGGSNSRLRIVEKLHSLPATTLPAGVSPRLGPDATGLGQVFAYTLEGRDAKGKPAPGWDRFELRKIQDWQVRYALRSIAGVAEVASIGGFVPEYHIEVDPDKLRMVGVSLETLYRAIRASNREEGVRTIEINRAEYVVQIHGYLKTLSDLRNIVIQTRQQTPVLLKDVATVTRGPAVRRGVLYKDGAEVVGGVVVAQHGANPLQVIQQIKTKIAEISQHLPHKKLQDGRISQVTVVPFYDRTQWMQETLQTLEEAITLEILIAILVIVAMMMHLQSSLLIGGLLPIAVLLSFLAMKWFSVDANIVALSGIAIAIGTMVDMSIILSENIVQHLEESDPDVPTVDVIWQAISEVGSAVLTAVATTVISFLPVFMMESSEGKLFRPLVLTKTFALVASLLVALLVLLPLARLFFRRRGKEPKKRSALRDAWLHLTNLLLLFVGSWVAVFIWWWMGMLVVLVPAYRWAMRYLPAVWLKVAGGLQRFGVVLTVTIAGSYLVLRWMPLGHDFSYVANFVFVLVLVGGVLFGFALFRRSYRLMLWWCLQHKKTFLLMPCVLVLLGASSWLGFDTVFAWIPHGIAYFSTPSMSASKSGSSEPTPHPLGKNPDLAKKKIDAVKQREQQKKYRQQVVATIRGNVWWRRMMQVFPGMKKEFLPFLDEGAFLWVPTAMSHASLAEMIDVLQKLDRAITAIPEVAVVVGKVGRMESALDSSPISRIELMIQYKPKFLYTAGGKKLRQWRTDIHTPQDIWREIAKAATLLGTTSSPNLQPIRAQLEMLQSGMAAPMGIKVTGPDWATIEQVAVELEKLLKQVPQIEAATVTADRLVGKPYLKFFLDRKVLARYGLQLAEVQQQIHAAIGGQVVTVSLQGRERYNVVVRYPRELRGNMDFLQRIAVITPTGAQIPLMTVASVHYARGSQVIKRENSMLVGDVTFDRNHRYGEMETIHAATVFLQQKIKSGEFKIPPRVRYRFAGMFENQVRSEKRLRVVLPLVILLIVILLYFQFRSVVVTSFIFSGILVAGAGGFLLLWLYQQPWFFNVSWGGINLRDIFSIQTFHLSAAVWVGLIALFGIATNGGVVMATYLQQSFNKTHPETVLEIRAATLLAGERRIRPCLMTTATTLLVLLPVLTSSGRGSDIMIPMAIPLCGGMLVALLTLFVVPVLFCWREEFRWVRKQKAEGQGGPWWAFWHWFRSKNTN